MSKGRKIFSFITLVFAIITMTTFVSAQDENKEQAPKPEIKKRDGQRGQRGFRKGKRGKRGMHGFRGRRGGSLRLLRRIELTEDQKGQIRTLMETQRSTNQPMREEARELYMKRRDGSITETEQSRLEQIRRDMKASHEQLETTILGLLTPEQTTKLEQMKTEMEQRRQERRRRWEERKQQRENSQKEDKPVS